MPPDSAGRIGYIVSRFPKLSETFIVREMDALQRRGWDIDLFAFIHPADPVIHPDAQRWLTRRRSNGTTRARVAAQFYWLRRRPAALLGLYVLLLIELWRTPGEFARGIQALLLAGIWAQDVEARDLQHIHAHWARHPVVAALALHRLTGVTFSFTGHSEDIHRHQVMLGVKVHHAAFVVCVSHFLRNTYLLPHVHPADQAKIEVVRCGLDISEFPPRVVPQGRPPVVLSVARLDEVKGLPYLIAAIRLLKDEGREVECRIVGEGPERGALEAQIARLDLEDRVTLVGALPREGVRAELVDADMFVLPSIVTDHRNFEGVPVSLMEAMASGVPVISTSTGAIGELVIDGETGLLVRERNPAALAAAIARLLDSPELGPNLAKVARGRLEAEFSIERTSARLDSLISQATGRSAVSAAYTPGDAAAD